MCFKSNGLLRKGKAEARAGGEPQPSKLAGEVDFGYELALAGENPNLETWSGPPPG
jgi:hypothetical protein